MLGVPITVSDVDLSNKIKKTEIFVSMGKEVSFDTDLPVLPPIDRNEEILAEAQRLIEQPYNRFWFSLFWYWEKSDTDTKLIELLRKGKETEAAALVNPYLNENITADNASAAWNGAFVHFLLAGGSSEPEDSKHHLRTAIAFTAGLLRDDVLISTAQELLDRTFSPDTERLKKDYLKDITQCIQQSPAGPLISEKELINWFSSHDPSIKKIISEKLIDKYLFAIEEEINRTKIRRNENNSEAFTYARELLEATAANLENLKEILGTSDVQYQMIADRLAQELRECSVVYHNAAQGEAYSDEIREKSLEIVVAAEKIAVGESTLQSVREAIKQLAPKPVAYTRLIKEITLTLEKSNQCEPAELFSLVKKFLITARVLLRKLKEQTGASDPKYLQASTEAAATVLRLAIQFANDTTDWHRALELINPLEKLDINQDVRQQYRQSKAVLIANGLAGKLEWAINQDKKQEYRRSVKVIVNLYNDTKADLAFLRDFFGPFDQQYIAASTAVATCILNSIASFASETRRFKDSLDLMKHLLGFETTAEFKVPLQNLHNQLQAMAASPLDLSKGTWASWVPKDKPDRERIRSLSKNKSSRESDDPAEKLQELYGEFYPARGRGLAGATLVLVVAVCIIYFFG